VLERCQVRRVRSKGTLRVPYTYVLKHLERWGLLGKEFSLSELAPVVIFAKQEATDPYRYVCGVPVIIGTTGVGSLLLSATAERASCINNPATGGVCVCALVTGSPCTASRWP
jgi:hypothetical protein